MPENQALLQQLRRASDFACITAWLRKTAHEEVGAQYVAQAADKALATWELEQFAMLLAAVEKGEVERMMRLRDQLGYTPGGWRIPIVPLPSEAP
jgi:hypothetical protein